MGALKVWDGSAWQTVSQQGPTGAPGALPSGGATGAPLIKTSATDYMAGWPSGVTFDAGSQTGQLNLSRVDNFAGGPPAIKMLRSRGTFASPSAPQAGDTMAEYQFHFNGTGGDTRAALLGLYAEEALGTSARTSLRYFGYGTVAGSSTVTYGERFRYIVNALCIGTAPTLAGTNPVGQAHRLRVNDRSSVGAGFYDYPSVQLSPSQTNIPALGIYPMSGQAVATMCAFDVAGNITWGIDRYGKPNPFVQHGSTVVTTDTNGSGVIFFPEAFLTNTPTVVATEASGVNVYLNIWYLANNAFQFYARYANNTPAYGNLRVNWVAAETRALT